MAEYHDDLDVQVRHGVVHAARHPRAIRVASDADHEEISQALIEDDLGRHPRVRAPDDGDLGVRLPDLCAALHGVELGATRLARPEACVPAREILEDVDRRTHQIGRVRLLAHTHQVLHRRHDGVKGRIGDPSSAAAGLTRTGRRPRILAPAVVLRPRVRGWPSD